MDKGNVLHNCKSLYEYLEVALSNIDTPTHEQIKQIKQDYWKLWYRHYRQQRRQQLKEYTLRFNAEHLKQIDDKRGTLSVSKFLYQAIQQALTSNKLPVFDMEPLEQINQQLLHLVNLLEDHLELHPSELTASMLERFEQLETQLSQFLKETS